MKFDAKFLNFLKQKSKLENKNGNKINHNISDEKETLPVILKIHQVRPNGLMTIHFSEKLKTMQELMEGGSRRFLKQDFL